MGTKVMLINTFPQLSPFPNTK